MLRLRFFSPTDLEELADLVRTSLGENYSQGLYMNIYNTWREAFIIAEENGRIIGFVAGVISENQSARILMLAVRTEFRCRGIGTMLVNSFMNATVMKGLRSVHLEVRKSNASAIRLYTRFGFQITTTLPAYYSDGEDGLQMWRAL